MTETPTLTPTLERLKQDIDSDANVHIAHGYHFARGATVTVLHELDNTVSMLLGLGLDPSSWEGKRVLFESGRLLGLAERIAQSTNNIKDTP